MIENALVIIVIIAFIWIIEDKAVDIPNDIPGTPCDCMYENESCSTCESKCSK